MDPVQVSPIGLHFQPQAHEVAGYVGQLAQELEALATSTGLLGMAACLRAVVHEAALANAKVDDSDPSKFRRP
jgi:hypothetical protein